MCISLTCDTTSLTMPLLLKISADIDVSISREHSSSRRLWNSSHAAVFNPFSSPPVAATAFYNQACIIQVIEDLLQWSVGLHWEAADYPSTLKSFSTILCSACGCMADATIYSSERDKDHCCIWLGTCFHHNYVQRKSLFMYSLWLMIYLHSSFL